MESLSGQGEYLVQIEGGVQLRIKVVPNASRERVVGLLGDRLKVAVQAPPEAGKANSAVCALLADVVGVPAGHVEVVSGHTRPQKTVAVYGITFEQVRERLRKSCT